jgi:hypothetical protein
VSGNDNGVQCSICCRLAESLFPAILASVIASFLCTNDLCRKLDLQTTGRDVYWQIEQNPFVSLAY